MKGPSGLDEVMVAAATGIGAQLVMQVVTVTGVVKTEVQIEIGDVTEGTGVATETGAATATGAAIVSEAATATATAATTTIAAVIATGP
mmetsp:Transcript_124425/g.323316  ORF Transcript_124425/g.323316 Transcript_124425/m.323316 type:complete len:89 (+) Transcript_124425:1359-1625(+)